MMSAKEAQAILEALVSGANPLTGEVLEAEHICRDEVVLAALKKALIALGEDKAKPSQPSRAGAAWSQREDDRLAYLHESGLKVKAIADDFQRSRGAIRSRLVKLGLIDNQA